MSLRKLSWWERLSGWVSDDPDKIYSLTLTIAPPTPNGGLVRLPELTDKDIVAVEYICSSRIDGHRDLISPGYFSSENQMPGTLGFLVGHGSYGIGIGFHRNPNRLTIYDGESIRGNYTLRFHYKRIQETKHD